MPQNKNKAIITRLNTDPKWLRIQIKSYETSIKSRQWSLDFAENKSSKYCDGLREDIQRFSGWITDLKNKLEMASIPK